MRSYLDIIIDLKDGKEVSKQELGFALLFANDQLVFTNQEVNRCLEEDINKNLLVKKLMVENRERRFQCRKNPIDKWFGDYLPTII